jgi:hypothetical protein
LIETAGPFIVRVCRGGEDWTDPLGTADDYDEADGKDVLTHWQAQDLARERARVGKPTRDLCIKARVEFYMTDLIKRGRDPENASRVMFHLAGTKLANKLVTASTLSDDLNEFRDHLAAKGLKPATIDRVNRAFKAALNLAAEKASASRAVRGRPRSKLSAARKRERATTSSMMRTAGRSGERHIETAMSSVC